MNIANTLELIKIGFASAEPFQELKHRLLRQEELGYQSGFEEPDIEKRTNPQLVLSGAQSIIAIALAYPSKLKNAPQSKRGERRGIFCRASWGAGLSCCAARSFTEAGTVFFTRAGAKCSGEVHGGYGRIKRPCCCRASWHWLEREKNCAIITPEFGSYVYLGEMLTNLPFPPDIPLEEGCGTCNKCVEVCPTGALIQGGQLDSQKNVLHFF
ncbi:hypothetical protein GCM10020331_088760 [Ectobacillus funiculus]